MRTPPRSLPGERVKAARHRKHPAANAELPRQISERKRSEDELKASLKEVIDLKAALDEHAIVAITDQGGKNNQLQ